jgi:chorismate mutase
MENISELRSQVDAVDDELVALLAKRFVLTGRIGEIKARTGEPSIHPGRHAQRLQLLAKLAETHGVEASLVTSIFDAIRIESVTCHERAARR